MKYKLKFYAFLSIFFTCNAKLLADFAGETHARILIRFYVWKNNTITNLSKFVDIISDCSPVTFCCVPGMALIQLEINQLQVFTAKYSEPQVENSNVGMEEVV